jgi:hypothetical protein
LLENGKVAIARDAKLEEEALAVEWQIEPKGRIQILSKDTMKTTLGRSPDRLDAVVAGLGYWTGRVTGAGGIGHFRI